MSKNDPSIECYPKYILVSFVSYNMDLESYFAKKDPPTVLKYSYALPFSIPPSWGTGLRGIVLTD